MLKEDTTISYVEPGSLAEEAGIAPGDKLMAVNGHSVHDILEYRYLTSEYEVELEVLKTDGSTEIITIENDYEELGIEFCQGLIAKPQSCKNKCIFCFIDQLPKGMRETVYFKDDDTRLSFLQGNYVTLTNLTDEEIDRLIAMHISPINISVHTTNPQLRVTMLKNPNAAKIYDIMKKFAQNGIYMSILLRPEAEIEQTVLITAATAVCVARAIEQVAECRVSIKWVNDLFIRQKKVCGILTEAAVLPNSKKLSYAIVGIGINLSDDGIPEEIREIAGGIVPTGAPRPSRERLIAEILNQLEALLSDFRPERFLSEYRDRSNLIGKSVSIIQNNIPIESGVAVDIDDDARLVVRLDSGELKHLSSGEISCRTE